MPGYFDDLLINEEKNPSTTPVNPVTDKVDLQSVIDRIYGEEEPAQPKPAANPVAERVQKNQQEWASDNPTLNTILSMPNMGLARGMLSTSKKMLGGSAQVMEFAANNLKNNITGGVQINEKGEIVSPWDKEYKQPDKSDAYKAIRKFEERTPKLQGGFDEFVGGLLPQVAAMGVTVLSRNPTVGKAYLASMYTSAFGAGLESYDDYKAESGEPANETERTLVGVGYGAAEYIGEKIGLDYFMPKGYGKVIAKSFDANPNAAGEIGKSVLENYARATKQPIGQVLKKIAAGSLVEGGEEGVTELMNMATDMWITGQDVTGEEARDRMIQSIGGGMMMGTMISPFSIVAQNKANTARRREQGQVTVGFDEQGLPIEIVQGEKGFVGIRPDGSVVPNVSEELLKNAATFTTEDFESGMGELKKKGAELSNQWEQSVVSNNIKANLKPITNPNTGKIHVIRNDQDEAFFLLDETPDGMFIVTDREGNKKTMGKNDFKEPLILDPTAQFETELQDYKNQQAQQQQAETFQQRKQAQLERIPNQLTIDGKELTFEPSEETVRRDESGNIVSYIFGDESSPMGMTELDSKTVEKYLSDQQAEAEKAQVEQEKESQKFWEEQKKEAEALQNATNVPTGDNNLSAERKIVTQTIGNTPIDIIEGVEFDEVVPSEKVPLEKALAALEKKFKDNKKFQLEVEKSQVEIPGETKYDDPTYQTVVKSIKIVPTAVIERKAQEAKARAEKEAESKSFWAEQKKEIQTNSLLNLIDQYNATPESRADRQKASEIERMAQGLGYQTDRTPMNEIRLFGQNGYIESKKPTIKENLQVETPEANLSTQPPSVSTPPSEISTPVQAPAKAQKPPTPKQIERAKILKAEPNSAREVILKHFLSGGKVSPELINRELIGRNRNGKLRSEGERRAMFWVTKQGEAKHTDQIEHILHSTPWESMLEDPTNFSNEVLDVLSLGSPSNMMAELKKLQSEQGSFGQQYSPEQIAELEAFAAEQETREQQEYEEQLSSIFEQDIENDITDDDFVQLFYELDQDGSNNAETQETIQGRSEPENSGDSQQDGQVSTGSIEPPVKDNRGQENPITRKIKSLQNTRSEIISKKKALDKMVAERNGLFGDTQAAQDDLFGGQGFDPNQDKIEHQKYDAEISRIDKEIELLKKQNETGIKESAGQMTIEDVQEEIEVSGDKGTFTNKEMADLQDKVMGREELTPDERRIWDEEQYAPNGYKYDEQGNLVKIPKQKQETNSNQQPTKLPESDNKQTVDNQNVTQNEKQNPVNTPVLENVETEKFTKTSTIEDQGKEDNYEPEIPYDENVDLFTNLERGIERKKVRDEEKKVEPNPTEGQKEAGNYKKGHVTVQGLDITIENPKGSVRSGIDKNGKRWSVTMNNTYGYFKRTTGKDGDHVDVFLGENIHYPRVFVIDQNNEEGSFDESKVMLGFDSAEQAQSDYMKNYSPGWKGFGAITESSLEDFRTWLNDGARQNKAYSEYKGNKSVSKNTIFTEDAKNAALERLRKSRGQLNAGIDPQMMMDMATIAGYHIESGARKFSDFAKKMIEDIGEWSKPYLKGAYENIRRYPGMETIAKEMDSTQAVDETNLDNVLNNETNNVTLPKEIKSNGKQGLLQGNNKRVSKPAPPSLFDGVEGEQRTGGSIKPQIGEILGTNEEQQQPAGRERDLLPRDADLLEPALIEFNIEDNDTKSFNPSQKYNDNIAAIKTVISLISEKRAATPQEKETLSKYVGFGGLKDVLLNPDSSQGWTASSSKYRPQVKRIVELANEFDNVTGSKGSLSSIKGSILNAHFTSSSVIHSVYDGLAKLGFKGGQILEPSSGIGNFITFMPNQIKNNSTITAVELDDLTGNILKYLHDDVNVKVSGIQDANIPNNSQDLVISNVPFGNYKIFDKAFKGEKAQFQNRIHNYFFAKAVDMAREGGLIAFVTSKGVMDAPGNEQLRRYLDQNTEFLGAVRLPNSAFKNNANTEVTTDIIFLKKSTEGTKNNTDFVSVKKIEATHKDGEIQNVNVNQYFIDNPQNMLGEIVAGGLYSRDDYSVENKKEYDLSKAIVKALPKNVYTSTKSAMGLQANDSQETIDAIKEGNIQVTGDRIVRKEEGQLSEIKINEPTPKIQHYIKLRNSLMNLIYSEYLGKSDNDVSGLRRQLNSEYNSFVSKYGRLDKSAVKIAKQDADGYNVLSLDVKNKQDGKADIFRQRTIQPIQNKLTAESIDEAIIISLYEHAKIDIERIAELMNLSIPEVIEKSKGKIFEEPTGGFVTRDEYLSGNVKQKLRQAQQAVENGNTEFQNNVDELLHVIPKNIPAMNIEARLGSRWIPQDIYTAFSQYLFNTKEAKIIYQKSIDSYSHNGRISNVEATNKYGTSRRNGADILVDALLINPPKIYDTFKEFGQEKRVLNTEETAKAIEKYEEIRQKFEDWVYKSEDRLTLLSGIYNERFNTSVKRTYNGDHLNISGINGVTLRKHQKDAIWMLLQNNGGIVDHLVGAGKTYVMVAGTMEMKRTGIAKKPMIMALKSTIPQIVETYRNAFPMAKVLAPTEKDFTKENRNKLFAQIANNEWDCIIMSHENYGKIPHEADIQRKFIEDEMAEVEAERAEFEAAGEKQALKGLEVRLKNLEARLEKISNIDKDNSLTFEQMGIDHIMVDESQQFKNLSYVTKQRGVAGLSKAEGSKRAFNLFIGIRYLQQKYGEDKGSTFLSGTPITNSMVEMYLLLKYLRPNKMNELGFNSFDSWATTFASPNSDIEFTVTGDFKAKTRFREFINVPELSMLYTEIADIRTDENTPLDKPKMKGNGYTVENIKMSEDQVEYGKKLMEFARTKDGYHIGMSLTKNQETAAMLLATNLSSKMAIDMRMINPNYSYDTNGKIARLTDNVTRIFNETEEYKGTQLIFSDLGTPENKTNKTALLRDYMEDELGMNLDTLNEIFGDTNEQNHKYPSITAIKNRLSEVLEMTEAEIDTTIEEANHSEGTFNVYAEVKKRLIEKGVPEEQIVFIHDYNTQRAKEQLFKQVQQGNIRIVLGSTQKLGTGVNVQDKVVAVHHLDVPWTPASMEQRNGRALRQGNIVAKEKLSNELPVYAYATERTLDAYKYQLLQTKQRFLDQVKSGDVEDRVIRESDGDSESGVGYAELVAMLSGNTDILTKSKLETKINDLRRRKRNFLSETYEAKSEIQRIEKRNPEIEKRIELTKQNIEELTNAIEYEKDGKIIVSDIDGKKLTTVKDEKGKTRPAERTDFARQAIGIIEQKLGNAKSGDEIDLFTINGIKISGRTNKTGLIVEATNSTLFVNASNGEKYSFNFSLIPGILLNNIQKTIENIPNIQSSQESIIEKNNRDLKAYQELIEKGEEWEKEPELTQALEELKEVNKRLTPAEESKPKQTEEEQQISDNTIRIGDLAFTIGKESFVTIAEAKNTKSGNSAVVVRINEQLDNADYAKKVKPLIEKHGGEWNTSNKVILFDNIVNAVNFSTAVEDAFPSLQDNYESPQQQSSVVQSTEEEYSPEPEIKSAAPIESQVPNESYVSKLLPVEDYTHTKTGEKLFNVKLKEKESKEDFQTISFKARLFNPVNSKHPFSPFANGFLFKKKEDAENFIHRVNIINFDSNSTVNEPQGTYKTQSGEAIQSSTLSDSGNGSGTSDVQRQGNYQSGDSGRKYSGIKGKVYDEVTRLVYNHKVKIFNEDFFNKRYSHFTNQERTVLYGSNAGEKASGGQNPFNLAYYIYQSLPEYNGNVFNDPTVLGLPSNYNNTPRFRQSPSEFKSSVPEESIFERQKSEVIKKHLLKLFSKGANTGTVHVVESVEDIPEQYRQQAKKGRTFGFYDPNSGESWFITGNIRNIDEAIKTWIHEVGGHRGLSNIIPEAMFNPLMEKLVDDIGMEEIKKVLPKNYWNKPKAEIGEEYLVHLGEKILGVKDLSQKEKSVWSKMVDGVRDVLNKLFNLKNKFTTKDAENLIRAAVQSVYQAPMPKMEDYNSVLDYNEAMVNYKKSGVDNPDIRFKQEPTEEEGKSYLDKAAESITKKPSKFEAKQIWEQVRQAIQDRDLPIRRLIESIVKRGGVKKTDADAYRDMTLAQGRAETLLKNFEKDLMQPVINAVSDLKKNTGINQEKITLYTIAKHAPERNTKIRAEKWKEWEQNHIDEFKNWRKNNPDVTDEEDKAMFEKLEKEKQRAYDFIQQSDYSGIMSQNTDKEFVGKPDEFANKLVSDFESVVPKEQTKAYWKAVNEVNKFTLGRWLDGNQITKDYYNQMVDGYKYYVPLKGWWDDAAKELDYHSGKGTGKSLQTAEGRKSLPDDPLAYMEHQAFKSISEQTDNEVKLSMMRFVMDNLKGNEDIIQMKRVYYVQNPLTQEWDYTLEKPDPELFAEGMATTKQYSDHFRLRKPANAKEHEVWVDTKYGTYAMVFPGKGLEVAQALNHQNNIVGGMDAEMFNKFLGGSLGKITNIQKALYTSWNITFPVKNILRDMPEAASHILIKYGPKQAGDFSKEIPKAAAASRRFLYGKLDPKRDNAGNALNNDAHFEDFASIGGMTGFTHLKTPEEYQKEISARVKRAEKNRFSLKEGLERFSELFEDTTRFAAYKSAVMNGMDKRDAALLAKEVSVNFNRKGKLSKSFDAIYAFFNAALQAGQKNLKLAKDYPKAFAGVAAGWVILGGLIAEMNRLFDDDDDEYERLNKFVRMNYLVFPIGNGEYFRMPLPQFFRGFYAMGANISDFAHGKTELLPALADGTLNFANALTPVELSAFFDKDSPWYSSLVPTVFKPFSEVAENKDFMNYPIYKEAFTKDLEEKLADSGMHKNNVNTTYKFITDALFELGGGDTKFNYYYDPKTKENKDVPSMLDINPSKIEYLVKGYTGGSGAFVNDLANTLLQLTTTGTVDQDNIPYVNSFIRKYPEKKWSVIGDYYKLVEKNDKWQKSMKEYKKQEDYEIFRDMLADKSKRDRNNAIKVADKQMEFLKKKFDNEKMTLDQYLEEKAKIAEQVINKTK